MPKIIRMCLVNGATMIAILFASMAGTLWAAERETSTDRPGLDYRDFEITAPLPAQCESACNDDGKCRAWTFAWPGTKGPRAHCFLKSGLPPKKADNCCISGIRSKPVKTNSAGSTTAPPRVEPPAPTPPKPSLEDACREYAQTAVAQNQQNLELQCELGGSRWGFDFDIYHNWCMTRSSDRSRKANTKARDRELDDCRAIFGVPTTRKPAPPKDLVRENACREYANRAVEQGEQALEYGCGFSGPRWMRAFQPHFSWCMSVGMAYHAREILERNSALKDCRPRVSRDGGCEQYAQSAFRLARQNHERKCGFIGPRWARNIDGHKAWCRNANQLEREQQHTARHKALAACSGGPREISACARYAQGAVKHGNDNLQRNCGLSGTRWLTDYEPHFIWCMKSTRPRRHAERSVRIRSLLKCSRSPGLGFDDGLRLYSYRWKQVAKSGSHWDSGWIKSGSRQICVHKVAGCRCGWQNYCANYRLGDVALWWPKGCNREPWKIVCEIKER